ncbi:MAG: ATPase, T2SS/T4P/T4SS family [Bilophila wadsworthia]
MPCPVNCGSPSWTRKVPVGPGRRTRLGPLPWLRKQKVVPVRDKDGNLRWRSATRPASASRTELGMLLGERLNARACPRRRHHGHHQPDLRRVHRSEGSVSDVLGDSVNAIDEFRRRGGGLAGGQQEAHSSGWSTYHSRGRAAELIHIEPYRDVSRVRFRLDGVLYERHTLNKAHHAAVVSRIKVMAKLNIAEKRLRRTAAHHHFPRRASGGAARVHPCPRPSVNA